MANLTKLRKLRNLAYKYQHAINYREESPYWKPLIREGLCSLIFTQRLYSFIVRMGYNPNFYLFPVVSSHYTGVGSLSGTSSQPVYLGLYRIKIKDVAKEVLQPRLDLLEQFIIELEIQNETLQELSERRD